MQVCSNKLWYMDINSMELMVAIIYRQEKPTLKSLDRIPDRGAHISRSRSPEWPLRRDKLGLILLQKYIAEYINKGVQLLGICSLRVQWIIMEYGPRAYSHSLTHWAMGDAAIILKLWFSNSLYGNWGTSCEIALRWMPFMTPYAVTNRQWVKDLFVS